MQVDKRNFKKMIGVSWRPELGCVAIFQLLPKSPNVLSKVVANVQKVSRQRLKDICSTRLGLGSRSLAPAHRGLCHAHICNVNK